MEKTYFFARTAVGLPHRNTLVVPKMRTVVVFIDQPHLTCGLEDCFRLIGKESRYDQTLRRADAKERDELRMALQFTDVPPTGTYSLYHAMTRTIEIPIFLDVPFADLPSFGDDAPAPARESQPKPGMESPPEPELDDPLLHTDVEADPNSSRYLDLVAYRTEKPDGAELA
jgi:hypothetical protein